MGFFRKQFLDVIQWLDESNNTLVYRYPMEDQEIQNGAQLTVRQGQVAVFVDKGQMADVFGPGMYELKTENLPLLSDLKAWKFGFKSPFKADVYFLSMREFLDNKWGTSNPIWIPDSQFGQVQVRAHGTYAFKIDNPVAFLTDVVGTNGHYRIEDIREQLRGFILTQFTDLIGSLKLTVTQIASNYNEIGEALAETLNTPFSKLGLKITHFTINNIGLPEEIEKSLQELTHMNIIGSVDNNKISKIQILKQLEIMEKSAENPSTNSMLQSGIGVGVGIQMASAFANINTNAGVNLNQNAATPNQNVQVAGQAMSCPNCHAQIAGGSKFCPECGSKIETSDKKFCPQCGQQVPAGSKFCTECGQKLS